MLDYDGDSAEMAKNLGDHLREVKATLPLILAMQRASAQDVAFVHRAIEDGTADDLPRIVRIVRESGALDGARQAAAAQAAKAQAALTALPANEYSRSLLELAVQLLQRRS